MIPDDPLAAVAAIPEVAAAAARARDALDPLLLDRRLRTAAPALAAEATLRNAHASATLEGVEVPIDELRTGATGSPLLRVAVAILEAQRHLRSLTGVPPRQAWAAIAAIAGRPLLPDERLGRPRIAGEDAQDPLHLGLGDDLDNGTIRLAVLADLLQRPTAAPALVVAAIAHGELIATQPFGAANGVVARAAGQLIVAQRGLDPDLLALGDVGLMAMGRAAYARAVRAYDGGGAEGVTAWCVHIATAFEQGALLARAALDTLG